MYKSGMLLVLSVALLFGSLVNNAFANPSLSDKYKGLKVEVFSAKIGTEEGDIVQYFDLVNRVVDWSKSHPKITIVADISKAVDARGLDITGLDLSNPRMKTQGTRYTIVILYTEK